MIYLSAAVVLIGALAALNLVLAFGVIRRLREHTEKLANLSSDGRVRVAAMKEVGEQVGEFAAVTTGGAVVSRASLSDLTIVGFLTAHCPPCHEMAPVFAAVVRRTASGQDRALAVVVGGGEETAEFVATHFADVVPVVVESDSPEFGPLVTAFGVNAFPSFCLVDDNGVITATANSPEDLPVLTSA